MSENQHQKEKTELFRTIWAIANQLRGSVDGWEFKNYVLGTIFYRYLSEFITDKINLQEQESSDDDSFNYAFLNDDEIDNIENFKDEVIKEIGFFLYPSELFCNVVKNAEKNIDNNDDLNLTINNIFKNIENSSKGSDAEKCFENLFTDFNVNNNSLGSTLQSRNKHLANLLIEVSKMKFDYNSSQNSIDLFGDAYEYLMGMYAANAGKSGGEYFTPQQVSLLLTKLCLIKDDGSYKTHVNKVYDPTCGSGSLLLKSAKVLHGQTHIDIGFYGQESNPTTYNLCRINMFLHRIPFDKFNIACGNTLTEPKHLQDEPFEVIVSNPPYSIKWIGDDDITLINDPRFTSAGVLAPKSKADFAFIMHSLHHLDNKGKAAIVCFPGIMYRSGAEQKIRQYLITNNFIDCIIQLPENLFFGTSIATCIMVLSKHKKDNSILFIDASKEFIKITNSNLLSDDNIKNILDTYIKRHNIDYVAKLVDLQTIQENKYNLSVNTYVEKQDTQEKIDITDLNLQIKNIVAKQNILRAEIDAIIDQIETNHED